MRKVNNILSSYAPDVWTSFIPYGTNVNTIIIANTTDNPIDVKLRLIDMNADDECIILNRSMAQKESYTMDLKQLFVDQGEVQAMSSDNGVNYYACGSVDENVEMLDMAWFSYDHRDGSYSNSFQRVTSVHEGMKRCVVEDDGTIAYFLDPYDSTKKENGSPAVLDGTDGQVMVRIPKFYANRFVDGDVETWAMSAEPKLGLVLHPAFYANDGTTELDYILVGAYPATLWSNSNNAIIDGLNLDDNSSRTNQTNDKLSSTSGNYVFVGRTRAEFRKLASNRGAGWSQWDYYTWQAILFLFYTEYGDLNSQDALGDGNVWRSYKDSSSNQADSPHVINGVSNSLGNQSGAVEDTNKNDTEDWSGNPFVSYRGIENLWGNQWQWIDGCYLSSYGFYVTGDQTKFADSTSNHSKLGNNVPSTSDSPIGRFQNLGSPLMLVGELGGDTDTYVGDQYWVNSSTRVVYVGGISDSARRAGGSTLNLSSAASMHNRARGARLLHKG